MTKTKVGLFGLAGLLAVTGIVGVSHLNGSAKFRAADVNTWKHFSAIMPTETSKGIREYWTDCVGGAPRFTAPEGITAADATLTDEQKAYILNHAGDERVIPTLSEIKRSVSKRYDGKTSTQGYDVACAYAYTYLDETTKAEVSGADESFIVSAYNAYDARFDILDAPLSSGTAGYVLDGASFEETYVDGHGVVYEMLSGKTSSGWVSFSYQDAAFDLTEYESVFLSVYNPTDSAWSDVRIMNGSWEGLQTITVLPHSWGEIEISKSWFDANTASKFSNWWLGIVNYSGYESATETLKIAKPVGVKTAYYADMAANLDSAIASISGKTLTMWDGADIMKLRSEYDSLPSAAKSLVQNLASLSSMEETYGDQWTCLNYSWVKGKVNASTQIKSMTVGHDDTYGVYTEFDATDSGWIVHFTPESDAEVLNGAKIGIYKPEGGTVSAYIIDNGWGNNVITPLADGWNVVDISASAFLNGVASGVSIGLANLKDAAGYKFTPLYATK